MDVRTALLEAAMKVFAEAGTRGATTRRIAQEAGVNEVSLFRHFGSKTALIHDALALYAERAPMSRLPDTPVDPRAELTRWARSHHENLYRARAFIRTGMSEFEEDPEVCSSVCRVPNELSSDLHAYLLRLRETGLASGDWDARAAVSMLMGTLFADAIGRDAMPARYPYSRQSAAGHYVTLFLRALGLQAPASSRRRPAGPRPRRASRPSGLRRSSR
jgi:AcrR family transcriptional regulator